jgi:hypothetical protein
MGGRLCAQVVVLFLFEILDERVLLHRCVLSALDSSADSRN